MSAIMIDQPCDDVLQEWVTISSLWHCVQTGENHIIVLLVDVLLENG
jgi:hypothetical protein